MPDEIKPYLIAKDDEGQFRLTLRETRRNSQGYPWIEKREIDQVFATTAAARKHAVEEFGAKPGEFSSR